MSITNKIFRERKILRKKNNVTILFQKLKNNESNNQNRRFVFFDIKISQTIQFINSFESLKTSKNKLTRSRCIDEIIIKRIKIFF